jgi:Putative DNA-binding domain
MGRLKPPSAKKIRSWITSPNWEKRALDFKSKEAVPDPSKMPGELVEKKDWEIARDIASFANTLGGGYLVVGVKDGRDQRVVEGYSISDKTKLRLAGILRNRINPPAEVDFEIIKIGNKQVTALIVQEGEGDACTVNGTVYVRDVNGRAIASAAEITRIVRRRLGKKAHPSPTDRGLVTSPYNLPTPGLREERMLADFTKVAPEIGFTDVKELSQVQPPKRVLISTCKLGGREWHFAVIGVGGHFGISEFKAVTGYDLLNDRGVTFPLKPISHPISKHAFFPLVLIMGRVGSLKSQLRYFGYAQMPLSFGAYIGPGLEREGSRTTNVKGINVLSHRFLLAGIIDLDTLRFRLEQFLTWLKQETGRSKM